MFPLGHQLFELQLNMPTLYVTVKSTSLAFSYTKPILCLLASQLLKGRHQHIGLVQRAVSVMMYGHGTAKQVC